MKWHEEFIKYADVGESKFPFIVVGNKVIIRGNKIQSQLADYNLSNRKQMQLFTIITILFPFRVTWVTRIVAR